MLNLQDFFEIWKITCYGSVGGVVPLKPPKAIGLEEIDIWSIKVFFFKIVVINKFLK